EALLTNLGLDRTEEVAHHILHQESASPVQLAWAVDQAEKVFPAAEEDAVLLELLESGSSRPVRVREALARLAGRWSDHHATAWREPAVPAEPALTPATDARARVRLAQELTANPAGAEQLLAELQADPHPHVRAAALTPERA